MCSISLALNVRRWVKRCFQFTRHLEVFSLTFDLRALDSFFFSSGLWLTTDIQLALFVCCIFSPWASDAIVINCYVDLQLVMQASRGQRWWWPWRVTSQMAPSQEPGSTETGRLVVFGLATAVCVRKS